MSITIRKTPCPDVDLEINDVPQGTFSAGSTIDVNLTDGANPVTPDSVTVVGDVVTVQVPACPPAVTRSTATLMKTGQTTSYRTGDDGDLQVGRDTDFLTLDAPPVHNDGSPTINTTTNRFTDINGLQVYGDNIILDWSTWNGSTLLGWYKATSAVLLNWNDAIDWAVALNISTFTGFRLPNVTEFLSICHHQNSNQFNYTPFNLSFVNHFSSTTSMRSTNTALLILGNNSSLVIEYLKTNNRNTQLAVRTFSLSTSNILS